MKLPHASKASWKRLCGVHGSSALGKNSLVWFPVMYYGKRVEENSAKLLDMVAVLANKPEFGLLSGQVGTVVELLAPGVFEVEFCDPEGRTIRFAELARGDFLVLRPELAAIA